MVSLHTNKSLTKIEIGTKDWGITVIGLTMCLEEFGLWVFELWKQWNV